MIRAESRVHAIALLERIDNLRIESGVVIWVADRSRRRLYDLRSASVHAACANSNHEKNTARFHVSFHIGFCGSFGLNNFESSVIKRMLITSMRQCRMLPLSVPSSL